MKGKGFMLCVWIKPKYHMVCLYLLCPFACEMSYLTEPAVVSSLKPSSRDDLTLVYLRNIHPEDRGNYCSPVDAYAIKGGLTSTTTSCTGACKLPY
jgi:hypothetical protein